MSKALATKNVAAVLLAAALVLGFTFAIAKPAKADTLSDLQAQVQALLAQIASLQGTGTVSSGSGACFTFTQDESQGKTGGEVMWVQEFLNGHGFTVAASGAGSPGNETSYFGALTKAAVAKWQAANGVSPAAGYWGPISRAKANSICASQGTGTGTGTGTIPSGPGISVTAGAQPANSLAPENASRVPFTTFTLTNNTSAAVTITGVTVQRTGLAADAAFAGVELIDSNGIQVGISHTFNSNHQATVGDTFTLNPGQSMTYTVAANMQGTGGEAAYAGQVASMSVVGVNTTVPVSGTLPISGAQQTINASLVIGKVTAGTSSYDPAGAQQKNLGDTGVKFSAVRLTAGSAEDVKLFSIRFRMNGSASASDLSNLAIVVNGTSYPAVWSADGRYVSASIPGGVLITKGSSADAYVQGDITGTNSSGRVAEFDVDKATDVFLVGQLYGYGIIPTSGNETCGSGCNVNSSATHGSLYTNSQPWFQGSTITIQGGTGTTIQNATSVQAQNIPVNVPNQPLGGFVTNFSGEPVTVQKLVIHVASSTSATGTGYLQNVSIVDQNGAVVAGPVDESSAATDGLLTFTDSVTFPVGSATYTLKGTVATGAKNGDTFQLKTTPSSDWTNVTGQSTGNTVSLSGFSSQIAMNTMTVQGLTLSVSMAATPASQTIVSGGQSILFANVQLDASASGEDVRINSIPLRLVTTGAPAASALTGCQLYDSNGNALNYGTNIVNSPSTTTLPDLFTFNNQQVIPKGTSVTDSLKCNVASGLTTGSFTWSTNNDSMTISGQTSGNSTSINTAATSNSGTMSVTSGGLTVSVDTAVSPSYALASGGTQGVTLGVIKFRPTAEAMTLQKIGVHLTSGNAADISSLMFYNSANQLIGSTNTWTSGYATSTLSTQITLPADTDTDITVKANLNDIGTSQAGVEGDLIKVDPSGAEAVGQASGLPQKVGATTGVSGVGDFATFPKVALGTLPTSGISDGRLMDLNVTADSAGSLGVQQLVFQLATSTNVTVTNVNLYAYSSSCTGSPAPGTTSGGFVVAGTGPAIGGYSTTTPSTPIQVGAGQTICFELTGTVSGTGSNYNVNTKLVGESAQLSSPMVGTGTALDVAGKFIWSPNATGTVTAVGANDYSNGYGLYPSSGLNQNRTQ
ncbi:MAG TPA: peptidoglycan-binding domain-containing protein [Candidatus Paceibacterota bacterium]|nr:peptidoglycan-binding domain-containing protein [Candidatus Paceibacterota bacterium]